MLLFFALLLLLSVFFLRQNNTHMITLRNIVLQADEQNKNLQRAVTDLRNYVAGHMNTGMGEQGIYLEHSYQRDYIAAVQAAGQGTNAGATLYRQADNDCRSAQDIATAFSEYTQCVTDKVAANNLPVGPVTPPSSDLYRVNFISPAWSPDVAGFTLLAAVLAGILLAGRVLLLGIVSMLYRANR